MIVCTSNKFINFY